MLFPEEDSPVLKDWIVKRLENTSVAPLPYRVDDRLYFSGMTDGSILFLDPTPTPTCLPITCSPSCTMLVMV